MRRALQASCFISLSVLSISCGDSASKPSVWDQYRDERGGRGGAVNPKCLFNGEVSVGSRKVKSVADISLTTEFHGEIAEVLMGPRTVKVDFGGNMIYVDGREHAKLPADAKLVEVRYLGESLSLSADGAALPALAGAK